MQKPCGVRGRAVLGERDPTRRWGRYLGQEGRARPPARFQGRGLIPTPPVPLASVVPRSALSPWGAGVLAVGVRAAASPGPRRLPGAPPPRLAAVPRSVPGDVSGPAGRSGCSASVPAFMIIRRCASKNTLYPQQKLMQA